MKYSRRTICASLLLFAMTTTVADVGFRCGQHLIDVGDTREKVLEYCGEPTNRRGYTWIYERGPSQFDILVHFEPDGTVNRIEDNPEAEDRDAD